MSRTRELLRAKVGRRVATVIANSAERLAAPFLGALISLVVIRRSSAALWGEFVGPMVLVQLGAHVAGWGNKEFLLREYSRSPARIAESWQTSAISRLALFALFLPALAFLPAPPRLLLLGGFWCLGVAAAQSLESLVLFRKDFLVALAAEVAASLLVLALAIRPGALLTAERLVGWFALAAWLKFAALLLRHRDTALVGVVGRLDPGFFRRALPFFLLGLTGLLQSRADLYAATWSLSTDQLGRYQILITMVLLLQSTAMFAIGPYARLLYRLNHTAIVRLSARLLALGFVATAFGVAAMHLVLERLYRVPAGTGLLMLCATIVLPGFYYIPSIYVLLRQRRQNAVLGVNAAGALLSFLVSLLLLPVLGVAGALVGAAAAQWSMLALYVGLARSSSRHEAALSRLS